MKRFLSVVALFAAPPAFAVEPPGVPVVGVGIVSGDQKMVFVPAKDGGIEAPGSGVRQGFVDEQGREQAGRRVGQGGVRLGR